MFAKNCVQLTGIETHVWDQEVSYCIVGHIKRDFQLVVVAETMSNIVLAIGINRRKSLAVVFPHGCAAFDQYLEPGQESRSGTRG